MWLSPLAFRPGLPSSPTVASPRRPYPSPLTVAPGPPGAAQPVVQPGGPANPLEMHFGAGDRRMIEACRAGQGRGRRRWKGSNGTGVASCRATVRAVW